MWSEPPYPHRRRGSVLICGFGPTLFDDLEAAPEGLPVIAVNRAACVVPAFALFTLHRENMDAWAEAQRGINETFEVHVDGEGRRSRTTGRVQPCASADYVWRGLRRAGGSGFAATRLAKAMGFDRCILAGVPMTLADYADGRFARDWHKDRIVAKYRRQVLDCPQDHAGVTSLSGWTRDILGAPE